MILSSRDPLPRMIAPEPNAPELGVCPRCRGALVTRLLSVWETTIPGMTRTQCDDCGLIETPAMRRQLHARLAAPVTVEGARKRPVKEFHLTCEWSGCNKPFVALRKRRRFCSRSCGNHWRLDVGAYRPGGIRDFRCGSEAA